MHVTRPKRSSRKHLAFRAVGLTGALLVLHLGAGCGSKCDDDGFAWQQDPSCLAAMTMSSQSQTNTESAEDSETTPTEATDTDDPPTTSVTGGDGTLWCEDEDMDGFGDPDKCTQLPPGEQGPPGTVNEGSDCDDSNPDTFPGSAEKDSETACMQDNDGDGHGDADPPPSPNPDVPIDPGTDCDDTDEFTFPGAAENDSTTECMKDGDEDGYGDMMPPEGVSPGTDCDDAEGNAWMSCGTCMDADMDGWYTMCDTYPPGMEMQDCDDGDPNTFPGAAQIEGPDACMTDADDDGYGDAMPSGEGVEPGTDCDDSDANTYTGAAEVEDPNACMADADEDGWGDANPPGGVTPGSDCNDDHPQVNPDDSVLITAPTSSGEISEVSVTDGSVSAIATVDVAGINPWIPTSVAINPTTRDVVASVAFTNAKKLVTMNYCGGGVPTEMAAAHNKSLCGLAFDGAGKLYGVDGQVDQIVMFEDDGSILPANIKPLTFNGMPLNVAECGMTYDCHSDRLLLSDSFSASIYSVNPADGTTMRLATVLEGNLGAGLAYEPVERVALSCTDVSFYSISLDGTDTFTPLNDLAAPVDDLEFAPGCN